MRLPIVAFLAGLALIAPPALAEPTEAERATLDAMLDAAYDIDPRTDEPAYRAAFTAALDHATTLYPPGHAALAVIEYELAVADFNIGRTEDSTARILRLLPQIEAGGEAYVPNWLSVMNALLVVRVRQGELAEARAIGDDVLGKRRGLLDANPGNRDFIAGLASSLNNSAFILNMDGKPAQAIAYMAEVEALIDQLEEPNPALLSYLGNTPTYWAAAGDPDRALSEGRRLTAKLEMLLPPSHPVLAGSYNSLSVRAAERGQLEEAERFSLRAIELAMNAEVPDLGLASSMRLGLAQTQIRKGDAAAGLASARQALEHLTASYGEKGELTLFGQHVRAHALRDLGLIEDAIAVAEAADAMRAETMEPANTRRIAGQESLAEFYLEAGRPLDAYRMQLAAQDARATGDSLDLWEKLTGEIRLGAYAVRAGIGDMAPVVAAHEQLRARRDAITASGEPDAVQLAILGEAHVWAMDAAMHAGEFELAFRFAQDALATKADRAAHMAAFRQGLGSADAAQVRLYQDRAEALRQLSARQLERMSEGVPPAEMAAMNHAIAAARTALAEAGSAIASVAQAATETVSLQAAQASLAPGEALLIAHPMPLGLGVLAVTANEVAMHVAPLKSSEVAGLASDMRGALTGGDALARGVLAAAPASAGAPSFDFTPGAQLHQALFGGEAGALLARAEHLRVAAGGALSRIPFSALAPDGASLAEADWLIRRHSLSIVASLATLGQQAAKNGRQIGNRVLGIGAPVLQGRGLAALRSSRGLGEEASINDLPPLPAAAAELDAIAAALGNAASLLLIGEDARESRVLAEMIRPADVIAFATHGLLGGEVTGLDEPALVLTPNADEDGLLRASQIAALEMDAEFVILSACNTGGPDRPGAAGLTGLASAFLYAGARNLLVSHWEVADDVALSLTVPTVKSYFQEGIHPAEGLRRAVLGLLEQDGDPRLQHPSFWGPFVYVGNAG